MLLVWVGRPMPRFYIGKHPCDDLPYIQDVDPDPRTGDPHFTFDGPDYSGWYVRVGGQITDEMPLIHYAAAMHYADKAEILEAGHNLNAATLRDLIRAAFYPTGDTEA